MTDCQPDQQLRLIVCGAILALGLVFDRLWPLTDRQLAWFRHLIGPLTGWLSGRAVKAVYQVGASRSGDRQ